MLTVITLTLELIESGSLKCQADDDDDDGDDAIIVWFNTFNLIAVLVTLTSFQFEHDGHSNIVMMKLVIRLFSWKVAIAFIKKLKFWIKLC